VFRVNERNVSLLSHHLKLTIRSLSAIKIYIGTETEQMKYECNMEGFKQEWKEYGLRKIRLLARL
jgi:hypothetical protein